MVVKLSCFYCGRLLQNPPKSGKLQGFHYTRDHIHPLRIREKMKDFQEKYRKVGCCMDCNQSKGNLTVEEFRAAMAVRMQVIPVPEFKFAGEQP